MAEKEKIFHYYESPHLLMSAGFPPALLLKDALFKASFLLFTQNWFAPAAS